MNSCVAIIFNSSSAVCMYIVLQRQRLACETVYMFHYKHHMVYPRDPQQDTIVNGI